MIWRNTIWGLKKTPGFLISKFSHFVKMTRKAANLALLIVQFSYIYAFTSTVWVGIGCNGPI